MDAKTFFTELGESEAKRVSELAGTSLDYFKQVMYGNRKFSHKLAIKIETASDGRMTRAELRPDIWGAQEEAA